MTDIYTETAVPETPVEQTPAPDSTAEQVANPEGVMPEAPPKTFTQKELDEIIQKRVAKLSRVAEREARDRESRIQQEITERMQRSQPRQAERTGEPKPAEFQDYESYITALTDYKVDQKLTGLHQQSEAQRQAQFQREQVASVQKKLSSAAVKYEDFNEVALSEDLPISYAMGHFIAKRDLGGDVAYFLGKNAHEAARISQLDDFGQIEEMLKIEAKLKASPAPTRVPAPIVPNKGNSVSTKHFSDMNYDEFEKYRRERKKKR